MAHDTEDLYSALLYYMQQKQQYESFTDEAEAIVCDLLADLMHLCDEYGVDFEGRLDMARQHYNEEIRI